MLILFNIAIGTKFWKELPIIKIKASNHISCLKFFSKVVFLLILYLTLGCCDSGEANIPIINVPTDISGEIHLRDIAESTKTIQLETSKSALLGLVYDVKLFND